MGINRENYEIYFLDYHEGRLEPGQVAELLVFLESNPGLKEEFEDFENILVTPDMSVSFDGKSTLKKNNVPAFGPINASNYETYFIADTEKQLTIPEQQWLAGFLQSNPLLRKEHDLYLNTHLQPDMHIYYPGKAGLRRSVLNTRLFYYYALSAAASIALLFAVYMYSGTKQEPFLTARQNTPGIPSAIHRNERKAIPQQEISVQPLVSDSKTERNASISNQPAVVNLLANERYSGERKTIIEILPRSINFVTSRDFVNPEYLFIRETRNNIETYATLYDQVNLANRMQDEQVLAPVVSSPKSMLRTGLNKLSGIFTGKETSPSQTTVNFWTIAGLGISGYNLLTDRDLRLLTQSNDSGKVVSYALKGDEFEFTRSKNKQGKP
jgi:hypothetical protein